jgi:hypothetical protein
LIEHDTFYWGDVNLALEMKFPITSAFV